MNNAILLILILVFVPSLAYANPIAFNPLGGIGKLFLIFLIEPVIIVLAAGWRRFNLLKFAFWWMVITFSTFVLLILIISLFTKIADSNMMGSIIGEIVVVTLEALILQQIINSKGMMKEPMMMSYPRALIISFVANAATIGAGFLFLGEPSEEVSAITRLLGFC